MGFQLKISPTKNLRGVITPPASKSQTIRGLVAATLAKGRSVLRNPLEADDTATAIGVCRSCGADIVANGDGDLVVESAGLPLRMAAGKINSGDSGITTRFILPMLGLARDGAIELDCGEQMRARPMSSLIDALNKLGMRVESANNDGALPLRVRPPLAGGRCAVDGITSQYISALLFSLPCAPNDSEVTVYDLHERPYLDMTLAWLDEQAISYRHIQDRENNRDIFYISGRQRYRPFHKMIPGDFSSAAYPIVAAALLPGEVIVRGLNTEDRQGDKRLVFILQEMGADITVRKSELIIKGGAPLRGVKIDCNDIPDLVPALAIVGTQAEGTTELTNVAQARLKETDRLRSMREGLSRMGAKIEEKADGLVIRKSRLKGAEVSGCGDHRTVMALAVAGLLAEGETVVDTAESVSKTFPNFVELMRDIGCPMTVEI